MSFWSIIGYVLLLVGWAGSFVGLLNLIEDLDQTSWWRRMARNKVAEMFTVNSLLPKIQLLAYLALQPVLSVTVWVVWLSVPIWLGIRFVEGQV